MKSIAVANQKGGVGKTNTVFHLAHYLQSQGHRVCVLDHDPQENSTISLHPFKHKQIKTFDFYIDDIDFAETELNELVLFSGSPDLLNLEKMELKEVGERFKRNVKNLELRFDFCLMDTGPMLGVKLTSVLFAADFVYIPMEMEVYSIRGLSMMIQTINNIKKVNKNLTFLGVLPSRFNRRNDRQVAHYQEFCSKHKNILIPHTIVERTSYGDALEQCVPVWKVKRSSARTAAKEIKGFAEYILKKVEE